MRAAQAVVHAVDRAFGHVPSCFPKLSSRQLTAPPTLVELIFVDAAILLSSGCAVFEIESTNRDGYLGPPVDHYWMNADFNGTRALRAFDGADGAMPASSLPVRWFGTLKILGLPGL